MQPLIGAWAGGVNKTIGKNIETFQVGQKLIKINFTSIL